MANNTRDAVGTYVYVDDANNNWSIHLTGQVATAGGFTPLTNQSVVGAWHQGRDKMRHVGIKRTQGGKVLRDRIPIATLANDVYKFNTKTVSLDGNNDWQVTGRIGEKKGL